MENELSVEKMPSCWDVFKHGTNLLFFLTLMLYYIYAVWEYHGHDGFGFGFGLSFWLFIVHIIGSGLIVMIIMSDMLQTAMHVGADLSSDIWRTIRWVNNYPCKLLKFGQFTWIVTSLWITSTALAFEKCHMQLCYAKQVVAVVTLIIALVFVIVTANSCANKARRSRRMIMFTSTDNTCAVCLEDLQPLPTLPPAQPPLQPPAQPPLQLLPCGHRFHRHCIGQWIAYNHTCPVCRYVLPEAGP